MASQAKRFVVASRMQVLSNRNGRCCLIGEEEVHLLLLPRASSRKLPHQRPIALEERVRMLDSTQFLDQCASLVVTVVDVAKTPPDVLDTSILHFFSFLVLVILRLVVEDGARLDTAAIEGGDSKRRDLVCITEGRNQQPQG